MRTTIKDAMIDNVCLLNISKIAIRNRHTTLEIMSTPENIMHRMDHVMNIIPDIPKFLVPFLQNAIRQTSLLQGEQCGTDLILLLLSDLTVTLATDPLDHILIIHNII